MAISSSEPSLPSCSIRMKATPATAGKQTISSCSRRGYCHSTASSGRGDSSTRQDVDDYPKEHQRDDYPQAPVLVKGLLPPMVVTVTVVVGMLVLGHGKLSIGHWQPRMVEF